MFASRISPFRLLCPPFSPTFIVDGMATDLVFLNQD
jgi:hypothetical protein